MNISKAIAGVLARVAASIIRLITASHGASPAPVRCYVNREISQYRKAKEEKM